MTPGLRYLCSLFPPLSEHFPRFSTALPLWSNSREVSFRTHTIRLVHSLPSFNHLQFPRYMKQSQRADELVFSFYVPIAAVFVSHPSERAIETRLLGSRPRNNPRFPFTSLTSKDSLLEIPHSPRRFQSGLIVIPILQLLGQESPRLLFRSHDCFQVSSI